MFYPSFKFSLGKFDWFSTSSTNAESGLTQQQQSETLRNTGIIPTRIPQQVIIINVRFEWFPDPRRLTANDRITSLGQMIVRQMY